VAQALPGHDVSHLTVANRTSDRLEALAGTLPADAAGEIETCALDDLVSLLTGADVVFTSVGTAQPIIDRGLLEDAVAARRGRDPLLVVDLGMPRNVAPDAGRLGGVELCDMDDLRAAVAEAITGRQDEVAAASAIVGEEVGRYRAATRARDAAPVISSLRSLVEETRQGELDRLRAKRSELTEEQWEQVDMATRALVAKLLHQPTVALKDAAGTPRGERLTEALRILFDL
jgi:glutamyl-tRNA reductase